MDSRETAEILYSGKHFFRFLYKRSVRLGTAEAKSFLGQCLLVLGKTFEAEALLTEALEGLEEIFPRDHTLVQVTREALERI